MGAINKTLIILGIVVVLAGLVAMNYTTTTEQSALFGLITATQSVKPYESFSIPLIASGVVLLLVGATIK
ncbi:MAG: hypothetical protein V1881_02925 [Candidatus Micrarchaeota archaeon]